LSEILTYQDTVTKDDIFCVLSAVHSPASDQRLMLFREGLKRLGKATSPFTFETESGGKPFIMLGKERIEISLSHTKQFMAVVVSNNARVGIDVEEADRKVPDRLQSRIISGLAENIIEPIRLWTIKEAFLKMSGSGLRVGMNKVRVNDLGDDLFEASTENLHAWILSFLWEKKYISIAWDKFPGKVA